MEKIYRSLKILPSFLIICQVTVADAQNYAPFNEQVTKRFYNSADPADNSYFFYADSVHNSLTGDKVFHQYFTKKIPSGDVDITGCNFWVPAVFYVADTTWLGVEIKYNATTRQLGFTNFNGNALTFDLSLNPGDSAIFYQNTTDKYFIRAEQVLSEAVYSTTDSVKSFTILHYNMANQPVASDLHQEVIKIGKQSGVIAFIDAYNFPLVEKRLQLKGQLNPLIGTYQMRSEDLYPFQVGDTLQFNGSRYDPPSSCSYYRTYIVTSRTETSDSVKLAFSKSDYFYSSNSPNPNFCSELEVYPDTIKFAKNSDFLGYPYNKLLTNHTSSAGYPLSTEDSVQTACGKVLSYRVEEIPGMYCDSCHCIGNFDSFASTFLTHTYSEGKGITYVDSWTSTPTFKDPIGLVYSNIGGQVCGSYAVQSIGENAFERIVLYPNPVQDNLTLSDLVDQVNIYSVDGRVIQNIKNPGASINVKHLPAGVYIFELRSGEDAGYHRIVKY